MNESSDEKYLLRLNENPIHFEPVTKITNVFYDEVTHQVFTVRSGGAAGINVKGPLMKTPLNFRIEDKGPVLSIKFSPNQQVLAVQRSSKSVEFQNFVNQEPDGIEYSQPCRGSSAVIVGFVWVSDIDFIIITNQGVEHYQITSEKRYVRAVKNHSIQSNWFVYCPMSGVLLLSSGPLGNNLQPFLFKNHQLVKLTKFEVEITNPPQPARLCLAERDVTPTKLYNQIVVLVLRHLLKTSPQSGRDSSANAEILVYTLSKDAPPRKTHVLRLDVGGKLAVSVLDNLVVVHHQASKTSSLYDVNLPGESDGRVITLQPFLASITIRPFYFNIPASAAILSQDTSQMGCEMYSPNWVFFQPNIIIDAIIGCLWNLELVLAPVIDSVDHPCDLFEFLLQRTASKPAAIAALKRFLSPSSGMACDIPVLGSVFDKLNESYRMQLDIDVQSQIATPASSSLHIASSSSSLAKRPNLVIDQSDIYSRILVPITESRSPSDVQDRFVVAVVNEYIRSLVQFHIPVQHFVYEVLIEAFARLGQFYQLHQLFQYHAVADSKPLVRFTSFQPAPFHFNATLLFSDRRACCSLWRAFTRPPTSWPSTC